MNKNTVLALIAVLVIAIGGYMFPKGNVVEKVVEKVVDRVVGSIVGPTVFDAMEFRGGVSYGNTNSTSTPISMTLRQSDVKDFSMVIVSPTGAAATKTLTFFASSTARSWLPNAGDMQETCFYNSTSTAATTLTFAAGTGIDLETASSSPTDLILLAGNTACFKFIRQPATASSFDISALMTEYTNAD